MGLERLRRNFVIGMCLAEMVCSAAATGFLRTGNFHRDEPLLAVAQCRDGEFELRIKPLVHASTVLILLDRRVCVVPAFSTSQSRVTFRVLYRP